MPRHGKLIFDDKTKNNIFINNSKTEKINIKSHNLNLNLT